MLIGQALLIQPVLRTHTDAHTQTRNAERRATVKGTPWVTVWAANHLQVNLFLLPGQRSDGRACSDKFKYSGEAAVALLISNDLVKCRPKESPLFRHAEQSRPFFIFCIYFSGTGALLFLSHTPIVCAVCQQWSETSLLINMINKTQQNRRNWPDKPVLMLFLEADLKRLFCMVLLLVVFLPSRLK